MAVMGFKFTRVSVGFPVTQLLGMCYNVGAGDAHFYFYPTRKIQDLAYWEWERHQWLIVTEKGPAFQSHLQAINAHLLLPCLVGHLMPAKGYSSSNKKEILLVWEMHYRKLWARWWTYRREETSLSKRWLISQRLQFKECFQQNF